jgi:hypothetical protein
MKNRIKIVQCWDDGVEDDIRLDPARAIKGREYFLPLGKRRAHSPQAVLLENFPCLILSML